VSDLILDYLDYAIVNSFNRLVGRTKVFCETPTRRHTYRGDP
jgi:hypothetical protein